MDLSIILVNYRSEYWLNKCLLKLAALRTSKISFEVILINNDEKRLILKKKHFFISKIINSKKNIGFGGANNLGAKSAKGDCLLFLNPDTLFEKDSLEKLFYTFKKNPQLGIISPKIVQYARKQAQPFTCGNKTSLLGIIFRNTILKPWNKKNSVLVDWVSGTALLIRKHIFENVGGFDENFFMYFEDQDLCLRVKELGFDILFYPHSEVLHFDGKCWPSTRSQKAAFYTSQDYFFSKHHPSYKNILLKTLKLLLL